MSFPPVFFDREVQREESQTTKQPSLFDKIETEFDKYHRENPAIFQMFSRFAFEAIGKGRKHIGANAIIERMRWETMIEGNDDFKVNNNYAPFYARLFMRVNPEHSGIFEIRKSRADRT